MEYMFITVEGCEGAGKSTLIQSIAQWFETRGKAVVQTREPGGTLLGKALRGIVVDNTRLPIEPMAELFLYMADRAQHVAEFIKPALQEGFVVIADRYIDSTIAYQGYARGLDKKQIRELNNIATEGLLPDYTIVLDVDPLVGLKRVQERLEINATLAKTRYEHEDIVFHQKLREAFLLLAKTEERFVVFDAMQERTKVEKAVLAWLATLSL